MLYVIHTRYGYVHTDFRGSHDVIRLTIHGVKFSFASLLTATLISMGPYLAKKLQPSFSISLVGRMGKSTREEFQYVSMTLSRPGTIKVILRHAPGALQVH